MRHVYTKTSFSPDAVASFRWSEWELRDWREKEDKILSGMEVEKPAHARRVM